MTLPFVIQKVSERLADYQTQVKDKTKENRRLRANFDSLQEANSLLRKQVSLLIGGANGALFNMWCLLISSRSFMSYTKFNNAFSITFICGNLMSSLLF